MLLFWTAAELARGAVRARHAPRDGRAGGDA